MPPVPLTNFTDADIRSEIIGTGGSIASSNYTFMDFVNQSDFSKFDPTYLAGATDKNGLVSIDQFRNYPIGGGGGCTSLPYPSVTFSRYSRPSFTTAVYGFAVNNLPSGVDMMFRKNDGSDTLSLDSGYYTLEVMESVKFEYWFVESSKPECPIGPTSTFILPPLYLFDKDYSLTVDRTNAAGDPASCIPSSPPYWIFYEIGSPTNFRIRIYNYTTGYTFYTLGDNPELIDYPCLVRIVEFGATPSWKSSEMYEHSLLRC